MNCLKLSECFLWLDSKDKVMHEIVTAFYIGNWLNDLDPMQTDNDCFVSHTIWFTIDCIYERVLLRFDPIIWQLEKQSILYSVSIVFIWILFNLNDDFTWIISNSFLRIIKRWFDFILFDCIWSCLLFLTSYKIIWFCS